jgi:hypothetical protein
MQKFNRSSGVDLEVPDDTVVVDVFGTGTSISRGRRPLPTAPVPMPSAAQPAGTGLSAVLLGALQGQGMTLVDMFEVRSKSPASAGVRGVSENRTQVALDVDEDENAVLLLEQDGVYSWHFAQTNLSTRTAATRRGPLVVPGHKRLVFDVNLSAPTAPAELRRRGPITDLLADKVRAFVLKFAARMAVGMTVKFLERNLKRGMVFIDSDASERWKLVEKLPVSGLPNGRSARVLLLIHGTFSNTFGSFGALTATDWGRTFLRSALTRYDLVLGFDHATLGDDPLENAIELLAALETTTWEKPPVIDAVAFSRGALVLRCLIEFLLPASRIGARVRRAIFVGATNGGTALAEPKNWEFFVDLYTNLAVAGCRIMQMFPAAAVAATVLKECIASLGAMLKYMAVAALEDRVAPGLAAMVPTGDFVARINEPQSEKPSSFASHYCIVTSDFHASLGADGSELPARLVRWLLESAAMELMGRANDLVVDVESMSLLDPGESAFVKERLDFGRNSSVFHTVYFTRPELVRALTGWLELTGAEAPADSPLSRIVQERSVSRPAAADENILITSADAPSEQVARAIRSQIPSYVIVERQDGTNEYQYAFTAEELLGPVSKPATADVPLTLREALRNTPLELHEIDASPIVQVGEPLLQPPTEARSTAARTIVYAGDTPVAVIPAARSLSGAGLKAAAERVARGGAPRRRITRGGGVGRAAREPDIVDQIVRRRVMPPPMTAADEARAGARRLARARQRDRYYFGASMPETLTVGKSASVTVTISLDSLEAVAGRVSGSAEVDRNRKLIVQIIPKTNLEVIGDDRFEMPPLTEARTTELMFDVEGTNEGPGEVWIIIRQGPTKLVTLVLRPRILAVSRSEGRQIGAVADCLPVEPAGKTLPILQIFERRRGDQLGYLFVLDMGDGDVLKGDSPPFKVDRAAYVGNMYKEIENRWLASTQDFDAFNAELRAYGGQLFDQLVPSTIQVALWETRDKLRAIHVLSEEPFIPWELVHLKPPARGAIPQPLPNDLHFFGQKGLVRWLHDRRNAPREIRIRPKFAHYAIPAYPHPDYELPAAQEEIPFLRAQMKARKVAAEANSIRMLLSTPGQVDFFHFSGHGEADTQMAAQARILLEGRVDGSNYLPDYLKADVIEQHARLIGTDGNRPLIVLNACQVGRAGWQLTSAGGFADAFLRAGAGAFLGTLWAVGDAPARTFTEAFYGKLLAGKSLANAAIAGRDAARRAREATWLAYAMYGHPYGVLRMG